MLVLCFTVLFFIRVTASPTQNSHCYPPVDPALAQYMVGYGSLMQSDSKSATYKETGDNLPIILSGFQRGWFVRGGSSQQTFLGVIKNKEKHLNAVLFKLPSFASIAYYDQREKHYCRVLVSPSAIQALSPFKTPTGQVWIYVPKQAMFAMPSSKYPIMQSYVDVFLYGCLEIQKKYHLKNFAAQCISTTSGWSSFWINDRLHPVRVLLYDPDYLQIDELLVNHLQGDNFPFRESIF